MSIAVRRIYAKVKRFHIEVITMKLKFLRYKNIWQVAVCLVLSASLVLGLAVPDLGMNHAQPGNPLGGGDIRDITILKVGEDAEDSDSFYLHTR